MKRFNNRGSILLVTMVVLFVIFILSIGFFQLNLNESNFASRQYYRTAAFWLAEAGINMYIAQPSLLYQDSDQTIEYGKGTIRLYVDASRPSVMAVHSVGTFAGIQREIRITYPAHVPEAYKNVLSSGKGIVVKGDKTIAVVNGQTRLTGIVDGPSTNANVFFEDIAQQVPPDLTSLSLGGQTEDYGGEGLVKFTQKMRDLMGSYDPSEVLYIPDADTHTLTKADVEGKKIIYVEGDSSGGNVVINSNDLLLNNQNITVISSGKTTFNQAGTQAPNSQLNIIAWNGYNETVTAASTHKGLIYTHGVAEFNGIKESSVTEGGVIADGGIVLGDIWSTKTFNYADMTWGGFYPPGFELFKGTSLSGVAAKPNSWKEIVR